MKVTELQQALRSRGLDAKGRKQELVERLQAALAGPEVLQNALAEELKIIELIPEVGSVANEMADKAVAANSVSVELNASKIVLESIHTKDSVPSQEPIKLHPVAESETGLQDNPHTDSKTTAAELVAAAEASSSPRFVRVDYFQRPYTSIGLLAWLEQMLGHVVGMDNLWVNSIKTHCYLTLQSAEQAMRCKDLLTGATFPATNKRPLAAELTHVSAQEAPSSTEAQLKPGEWRPDLASSSSTSKATGRPEKPQGQVPSEKPSGQLTMISIKPLPPAKRSSSGGLFSRALTAATTKKEEKLVMQTLKTLQGDLIEGYVTSRFRGKESSDLNQLPEPQQQSIGEKRERPGEFVADLPQTKRKTVRPRQEDLDSLFRKTKCEPHLYWMPVPPEVVEKRRKALMESRRLGSCSTTS
jgi:hypothetical protein